MMYLDTSVLVALHAQDAHTDRALRWLSLNTEEQLVISDWSVPEFASALARKVRMGRMSEFDRHRATAQFNRSTESTLTRLPVDVDHFSEAALMIVRSEVGLRSGDALHLAVAGFAGLAVCTFDTTMAAAARSLGILVANSIP